MLEAAVVLDKTWRPLYFHAPHDRAAGHIPDSHALWKTLHENRGILLGVAHSHPGGGVPAPSYTDLTTFASLEADLGVRLVWPIVTTEACRAFVWVGPERLDYAERSEPLEPEMLDSWLEELRRLSYSKGV